MNFFKKMFSNGENLNRDEPTKKNQNSETTKIAIHIDALKDKEKSVRENAAKKLAKIGASAVEPLIKFVRDNTVWRNVDDAIEILVKIGAPTVDPLISILKDEHEYMRKAAAQMLGRIKEKRAIEPLLAALEDEDSDVCLSAADALEKLGWKTDESENGARFWTAKYLYENGADSEQIRQNAADALKTIQWQPDKSTSGATCWIVRNKWDKCVEIGIPAVKPLFITLQNKDKTVQQTAANALVQIGELAVNGLIDLLNNYFNWSYTDNSSMLLRINAANVLGKIGDPRAIDVLVKIGSKVERTLDHRRAAADALGLIGAPAFESLITMLKNNDANLQQFAAWGLGKIGDPRAIEHLIPILSTQPFHYPHARSAAREALKAITGQDFGEDITLWQQWSEQNK